MINRAVDDVYTVGKRYPKNIIIFGHSVDPLDKEIFRSCFELAELKKYQYQFIFCYYDQFAKQSIVKNLAIILGKSRLIELTGKNKIKFINSKDVDRMKMELYWIILLCFLNNGFNKYKHCEVCLVERGLSIFRKKEINGTIKDGEVWNLPLFMIE